MTVLSNSEVKECPQFLVDLMKLRLDASYKSIASKYKYDDFEKFVQDYFETTIDEYNKSLDERATQYVKQQLVTEAIAEKENIAVSDEEYQETLKEYMDGNGVSIGLAGLESGLHGGIVDVRLCSNYGLEFQRSCQRLGDNEGVISDDIIGHIGSAHRVYQRPFDGTAGGGNCAGGEVEGAVMDEAVDVMAADSDVRGRVHRRRRPDILRRH